MTEWSDQGIILRRGLFHESDMWLKILFRERGLVTAFAFGATKSRIRFCGCLDILNTILGSVKTSGRGRYLNLREASLLESPRNLRRDWRNMGAAANCLRFLEAADPDPVNSPRLFDLVENLRSWLERETKPVNLAPLFFRFHLAGKLGYAPDLLRCARCGAAPPGEAFFATAEGLLYCPDCGRAAPDYSRDVALSPLARRTLAQVQTSLPEAWPKTELIGSDKRAVSRAADNFIEYHLGLRWDNGFFRRV